MEDDSSTTDSDWDEPSENSTPVKCIFCDDHLSDIDELFTHTNGQHNFNLPQYCISMQMDCILYIKFINYVRSTKTPPETLKDIPKDSQPWMSDEFMKPAIEDDDLLTYDIETLLQELPELQQQATASQSSTIVVPVKEYKDMVTTLMHTKMQLEHAMKDMGQMRETARLFLLPDSSQSSNVIGSVKLGNGNPEEEEESDSYFASYAHFSIHQEMLQDEVRTESYRTAILENRSVFCDKVVLDVGCGTGILSMFAASAGAKAVVAVDQSDIVYQAMDIVKENGLDERINIVKGRIEDANLPFEKVNIIISEWMGYFLLFEGMLDSVIYARDKYLAEDGLILPDSCRLMLSAVSDLDFYQRNVGFWENVYGYKMSCMKKDVISEAVIDVVKPEKICSEPVLLKSLDLLTCTSEDSEFRTEFEMKFLVDAEITGLVGYFECNFDKGLPYKVQLSTSPYSKTTHWKQTMFFLTSPIKVSKGEVLPGKMICKKNRKDLRSLVVTLTLGNYQQKYLIC